VNKEGPGDGLSTQGDREVGKVALVVDDSMTVRKLVGAALAKLEIKMVEAANGRDALDRAAENPDLALVITDLNMPIMDGLDFIRGLREQATHRFTKVVFLTTEAGADKIKEAREAGATAWIVKPFHPEKILSLVQRLVA
jgi:two-component system chemotaxis response regulator CheY